MIQLQLTTWPGKNGRLWECSSHGVSQWSNPNSLTLTNTLAFLWQRLNSWRFEGPRLWCICLRDNCLTVYALDEQHTSPILDNLTARQVHDEIQIYMRMMESKEPTQ